MPADSLSTATRLATEHYENFPVGSRLVPAKLRPHVHRLYAFARVADDLADEARDLDALRAWRAATVEALRGSQTVPALLVDLAATVRACDLDPALLFALLDAFERDLSQSRYADLDDLLSYCESSANPVGRLMLQIFDRASPTNDTLSDYICTALQILNHLQDIGSDYRDRDRIYLPADMLERFGVREPELGARTCSPGLRSCISELAAFCGRSFHLGWDLPKRIGGRFGLELRAIINGACLVLDRMQRSDHDVLRRRPRVRHADAPDLLLRSLLPWPPRSAR